MILAAVFQVGLLLIISVIMQLDQDFLSVFGKGFSGKDLVLIYGGLFLLYKSTKEIYHKMEGESGDYSKGLKAGRFSQVIVQILIMDVAMWRLPDNFPPGCLVTWSSFRALNINDQSHSDLF